MEKIKLKLEERKNITKSFAGQEIIIKPFVDLELLSSIVDVVFYAMINDAAEDNDNELLQLNTENKVVGLKRFNLAMLDQCSNIDIEDIDMELLLSSGVDEYVLKFVTNYSLGKDLLMGLIAEYNLSASLGEIFNDMPSVEEMNDKIVGISDTLKDVPENVLRSVSENYLATGIKNATKIDSLIDNKDKKLKN